MSVKKIKVSPVTEPEPPVKLDLVLPCESARYLRDVLYNLTGEPDDLASLYCRLDEVMTDLGYEDDRLMEVLVDVPEDGNVDKGNWVLTKNARIKV